MNAENYFKKFIRGGILIFRYFDFLRAEYVVFFAQFFLKKSIKSFRKKHWHHNGRIFKIRSTCFFFDPGPPVAWSKTSKFCYLLIELGKVVWWAALAKTVSLVFEVIEKISTIFSGSFERRVNWMHFSERNIFISKIFSSFMNRLQNP